MFKLNTFAPLDKISDHRLMQFMSKTYLNSFDSIRKNTRLIVYLNIIRGPCEKMWNVVTFSSFGHSRPEYVTLP